jgi:hypothetical protein
VDPFANPDRLLSPAVEKKLGQLDPAAAKASTGTPPPAVRPPTTTAAAVPAPVKAPAPASAPASAAAPAQAPGDPLTGKMPLGVKSVLDAYGSTNGLPVVYLPVPVVTTPQQVAPAGAPTLAARPGPKAAEDYTNAFSMPGAGRQGQPTAAWRNAFSGPEASMPARPVAPIPGSPVPVSQYQAPPGMMPYPPGYVMQQPAYPPGYVMQQPAYPPGYVMQQPAYPPAAHSMPGIGAMPAAPAPPPVPSAAAVAPAVYHMPAAAAPVPAQPVAAATHASPATESAGMSESRAAAPAVSPEAVQHMASVLKTSLYPSQREWAADYLAGVSWRTHQEVVPALLTAAREDPAPTVRTACIRCLARMDVSANLVSSTLQGLQHDANADVRAAAEQALARLQPVRPPDLQQVGAVGGR